MKSIQKEDKRCLSEGEHLAHYEQIKTYVRNKRRVGSKTQDTTNNNKEQERLITRRNPKEFLSPLKTSDSYLIAGQGSLIKAANKLTISCKLNRNSPKSFHHVCHGRGPGLTGSGGRVEEELTI